MFCNFLFVWIIYHFSFDFLNDPDSVYSNNCSLVDGRLVVIIPPQAPRASLVFPVLPMAVADQVSNTNTDDMAAVLDPTALLMAAAAGEV